MKNLIALATLFLITNTMAFDHTHKELDNILKTYVLFNKRQSLVNYKELKNNVTNLDKYLQKLSSVRKIEFHQFNSNQQLAFLINAYNAFTLKIIIQNYPVKSIKDIGSFFKSTWKKKFFTLLESHSHLDNIEHNLIRKKFNEPRVHFALNCASIGCPSLLDTAYIATNLDSQLEKSTKSFLSNKEKNHFTQDKLYLSKIFKWYEKDFIKKNGSIERFVAPYIGKNKIQRERIIKKQYPIEWTNYNWNLNSKK